MIIVIRIAGMVEIPKKVAETLDRMRLRRKYSAIILNEDDPKVKALGKVRNYVAYGSINDKMLKKLIELRGQPEKGKKIDLAKISSEVGKKSLKELELKPFFRLHPPRKGIESKKHFGVGKGVLGDHKEKINDLLERML